MKRFLLIFSVGWLASLPIALLISSFANASSDFDDAYITTDELRLSSTDKNKDFIVNERFSELILNDEFEGLTPRFYNMPGNVNSFVNLDHPEVVKLRESYKKAIIGGDGSWVVSNQNLEYGSHISIAWTEDKSMEASWRKSTVNNTEVKSLDYNNFKYRLKIDLTSGANKNYVIYNNRDLDFCAGGNPFSGDCSKTTMPHYTIYNYIAFLKENYPDGYNGLTFQTGLDLVQAVPRFIIEIGRDHENKPRQLTAQYINNIKEFKKQSNYRFFNWKIYRSNNNWEKLNENEPINPQKQELMQPYRHDFSGNQEDGNYILSVDYVDETPIPLEKPDIKVLKHQEFKLVVNGKLFVAGNWNKDCPNGICPAPEEEEIKCDEIESLTGRLTCEMENRFNFGLINPSINAFKKLFSSFLVPANPVCSLPLADADIASRKFPVSQFDDRACSWSQNFRATFPIAPTLINFLLSLTIFGMLVGLINRITNNEKHDLIEGVNSSDK